MTIANVSLPQIQGALSAGPDQVAWVVTANLIATAVAFQTLHQRAAKVCEKVKSCVIKSCCRSLQRWLHNPKLMNQSAFHHSIFGFKNLCHLFLLD